LIPHDKALIDRRLAPYKFGQTGPNRFLTRKIPSRGFFSDYDGEPDPELNTSLPLRKDRRRFRLGTDFLAGVVATAAAAVLFAMFSSDATRDIIVTAKASIAASLPTSLRSGAA